MTKPLEKPAGPVVLSANVLVDGKFISAGSETPFSEATLPEHLRQYLATGQEDFYSPSQRNIYGGQPPAPDVGFVYQPLSGGQWRRQAGQVANVVQEQDQAAEAAAANELPEEVKEVLQAEHDLRIGKARAQMKVNQDASANAYEAAAQRAEEVQTQYFVRRGGAWGKVQNCQLRPGETVFVKRENGQMEAAGTVNAAGEPPPSEFIT
jgi:hypothetical protein